MTESVTNLPTGDTKTILVIEDEIAIVELVQFVLEGYGYHILTAYNGRAGLARLQAAPPHLVLCDIMMPGLDGIALCQAMQADPALQHIPLVLMSAAWSTPPPLPCHYAAFLHKPFDIAALVQLVHDLIGPADPSPTPL